MFLGGTLCFAFAFHSARQEDASVHEPPPVDADADVRPYIAWERMFCGLAGGGLMIVTGFYFYDRQAKRKPLPG
jgi:hypothetical protein